MIKHDQTRLLGRLTIGCLMSMLLGVASAQNAEPIGGYLDWVFYDALPSSEQRRISQQCPGAFIDPWQQPRLAADTLSLRANQTSGNVGATMRAHGEVALTRNVLQLFGPELHYNTSTGAASLPLGGLIRQPDLAIQTARADTQTSTNEYTLYDASYVIHLANLHGQAQTIDRADRYLTLERTWITRCAPGSLGWSLAARTLLIDDDTDMATAYHAVLRVGPVPVAYSPYLRFPLNQQRTSGFLTPQYSVISAYDQQRLATPYFWAIAPNFDNTTTLEWIVGGHDFDAAPRYAHGRQEWRMLQPTFTGEAEGGYYPNWGSNRRGEAAEWGYTLNLSSRNTPLRWQLNLRNASDDRYFPEFFATEYSRTVTQELTADYTVATTATRLSTRFQVQHALGEAVTQRSQLDYVEQPGIHLQQPFRLPGGWRMQGSVDWERRVKAEPDYLHFTPTVRDPLLALRARHRLVLTRTDGWRNWTLAQRYTADHTVYQMPQFLARTGQNHPAQNYQRVLWDLRHRLSYRWSFAPQQTFTPFALYEYRPLAAAQITAPLMNESIDRLEDLNRVTLGSSYRINSSGWRFSSTLQQTYQLTQTRLTNTSIRPADWPNPQAQDIQWNNRLWAGQQQELGGSFTWRRAESDAAHFWANDYELSRIRTDYTLRVPAGGLRLQSDWDLSNATNASPYHRIETALMAPLTPVIAGFVLLNWERTQASDPVIVDEMILGFEYDGCCWHLQLAVQRSLNDPRRESSEDRLFDTIQLNLTLKGLGHMGRQNILLERVTDQLPGLSAPVFRTF